MEAARRAAPDELARLAELVSLARDELIAQRGGALLAEDGCATDTPARAQADHLNRYLSESQRSLWAGTLDQAVVGVAAVSVTPATARGRFDALYVEPPARGVGVGAALVEAALEWLRGQGCTGVDIVALPGNRAAKQFLEGQGLVARLIVMHRPIQ